MGEKLKGKIVKGIAGFYYVHSEGHGVYECKAKGTFRNKSIKPLAGDYVEFYILDEENKKGSIEQILPRKNSLIRPAVANIDQAVVVFAAASPEPHLNLLDRFLIQMNSQGVPVTIVFNKIDLVEREFFENLRNIYQKAGYRVIGMQAKMSMGIDDLKQALDGKTSVLAGPSGVGKSTIMNLCQPKAGMVTGDISRKIQRGKNTTRHTELVHISKETYLVDTPGFSSLYIDDIPASEIFKYYPEMLENEGNCRFSGCAHIKEPNCGIKKALLEGKIAGERYENYCKLYSEAMNRKKY